MTIAIIGAYVVGALAGYSLIAGCLALVFPSFYPKTDPDGIAAMTLFWPVVLVGIALYWAGWLLVVGIIQWPFVAMEWVYERPAKFVAVIKDHKTGRSWRFGAKSKDFPTARTVRDQGSE